jgi:hypothetical protein
MNKLILLLIVFIGLISSNKTVGQVTIGSGTPPHESAVLELVASNKGFLGPRVALSDIEDAVTIANPADGLLIFNIRNSDISIAEEKRVTAGKFYYWSEDLRKWMEIIDLHELENKLEAELSKLGIPRPAIFRVDGTDNIPAAMAGKGINDILRGIEFGNRIHVPFITEVNKIPEYLTLTTVGNWPTLVFKPGVYSITFSFNFLATNSAPYCTNASYFMEFPIDPSAGDDRARIHANVPHSGGPNGHHSGSINYVTKLTQDKTWPIFFGLGQAGNCLDSNSLGRRGHSLANDGSFLYILRIGD